MLKRCGTAFIYSSFLGMVCNLIIEVCVRLAAGIDYSPLTPEFVARFPSYSIALIADMLLYGVIGLVFAAMMFLYDIDRLGFVIQNVIYYVSTGIVWIPIVTFLWQLQRYPEALRCVIIGFILTDVIMTVAGYVTTKKNVAELNAVLEKDEIVPHNA